MTADEVVSLEMSLSLRRLASPSEPGEKLKAIYGRLSARTGLTYGQVKRIWRREWKVIPGSIVRRLDTLVAEHERRANAEQETLRKRFYALAHHSSDPDFYQARTATADSSADEHG